jgi:CRISPR-associated protein Csd1
MSWMQRLYDTYEQAGKLDLPQIERISVVGHTRTPTAHIQIVLNEKAKCIAANLNLGKNFSIVLPVTEESLSRTSTKIVAHGIADKLQYIGKDLPDWLANDDLTVAQKVKEEKHLKKSFETYFKQLDDWCKAGAPRKVQLVRDYVQNGEIVADLVRYGIFLATSLENKQTLQTRWIKPNPKINRENLPGIFRIGNLKVNSGKKKKSDQVIEINPSAAVIYWAVQIPGVTGTDVQEDEEVQSSWIKFMSIRDSKKGFCHVLGKGTSVASKHQKVVGNSKLISSDDNEGYTFRGRFDEATQAVAISSEVTQKAHNALRWLITRQGISNGDQVTVAWAISGKPILNPVDDWSYLESEQLFSAVTEIQVVDSDINHSNNLGYQIAHRLKLKLRGYQQDLSATEQLSLMVLDSATPGRMAISYYREFLPDEYFRHLNAWYEDFSWHQRVTQKIKFQGKNKEVEKTFCTVLPPTPKAIAEAVYGPTINDETQKKFKKQVYSSILLCIAEDTQIPYAMMQQAVTRASNPFAKRGDESTEQVKERWERNLCVACALYKGFYARHTESNQRKDYSMNIDANTGRGYSFGRLLAIADKVENLALSIAKENRPTTAMRLMQRFSVQPMATWRNIEEALIPYYMRIQSHYPPLVDAYKNLIGQEIQKLYQISQFNNDVLDGEYLLGYHLQRRWFDQHKYTMGQWVSKDATEQVETLAVDQ